MLALIFSSLSLLLAVLAFIGVIAEDGKEDRVILLVVCVFFALNTYALYPEADRWIKASKVSRLTQEGEANGG